MELKKILDLIPFKNQSSLYTELKHFKCLKSIELDTKDLILTKTFFENISNLEFLNQIKLNLKCLDMGLFKWWSSHGLAKVRITCLFWF